MKGKNSPGATNERLIKVRHRLQAQLEAGTKPPKSSDAYSMIELSDDDKNRIKAEITTISSRIVSVEVAFSSRSKKNRSGSGRRSFHM